MQRSDWPGFRRNAPSMRHLCAICWARRGGGQAFRLSVTSFSDQTTGTDPPVIKPRLSAATWALSAVAAGVLLVGCSGSVSVGKSDPKLSKAKLADTVAERLAATTGRPKPDVTCQEDLVGKVGNTGRCTLTASDGSKLGVTVKVSSVEADSINFDIKADDAASPAS